MSLRKGSLGERLAAGQQLRAFLLRNLAVADRRLYLLPVDLRAHLHRFIETVAHLQILRPGPPVSL